MLSDCFFLVTLENDTQVLLTELLILGFGAYFGLTPMQQRQCRNGKDFSTAYKQFHICNLLIYNKIFHPVHEHAERMMVWQSLNAVNFYSSHQSASSSKLKKQSFSNLFNKVSLDTIKIYDATFYFTESYTVFLTNVFDEIRQSKPDLTSEEVIHFFENVAMNRLLADELRCRLQTNFKHL